MEQTPFSSQTYASQGQPFRVTYKSMDYHFRLLDPSQLNRDTSRISLYLDGQVQTMVREGKDWRFENLPDGIDADFAQTIWRSICLRYRF
ncbi:hypothetical protein SAMN05216436_10654 [bacterium A37T11]|nr:hypothetical protein SAMN05216436_10654 [bacterium A37T11]